ncbi:hypothetical protein KQY10_19110 [Leptospira interrogans]|uniref:Uncharacterized protein n=1 Tax=Leptospira interrogans serovar Hardjo str. Norma TaxID=1279460 RepID=A0A0M3TKJ1_LEPIR|nr:hypothetical protein [Leptospira interrogans]ALE37445.1 hypothetical protein G436_0215 [Leptospira interrogans serovar Hardjo str. Norma]ALN98932.1 hypothetical protein LIH_00985 [Leptospira interrogans serovar Hardjo-prajitno]EKO95034.1 hypothetical protein LEP1GSC057_0225 [Leptospira interrogans str. Brem 329]EMO92731.1 hypothetical protein LEP1GSC109_4184 [Leptospira interrogans str. UI 13372]MCD1167656.1 hypothetical protein [Leptospira interrogans]
MDKLSGIEFPGVGKRVFPEDWKKEQESKSQEIINRDLDLLGFGIQNGGTIVIGSGPNRVDLIDTLIAYDEEGKRIQVTPIAGIPVPNNVTCTLVVRHKFLETQYDSPSNLPSDGTNLWRDNSFEILTRQGLLVTGDVPLRLISSNASGVVSLGTDLRTWRGIFTNNIKDGQITEEKQASSVKTGLITDLHAELIGAINPDVNHPLKLVQGINQAYLYSKNFIDVTFKQERKFLGEMFWMDDLKSPSIDFPAFCLASPDQLISVSGTGGMPDLVSYWLNKPLRYDPLGNNITDFDTISYTISSNVLTVTFPTTTACQKIIDALGEDYQVQGSFTNWMTGTILQTIGGIPANSTLAITAFSSASRTISFSCTATNSSGSLSGVKIRFYKHRLPDITPGTTITNQVRHFTVQGRGFVSVMDSDSDWIGGLRRRDRFQGHYHEFYGMIGSYSGSSTAHFGSASANTYLFQGGGTSGQPVRTPNTDGTNGPPRAGKTTDARGISGFPYIFVRRVL